MQEIPLEQKKGMATSFRQKVKDLRVARSSMTKSFTKIKPDLSYSRFSGQVGEPIGIRYAEL